MIQDFLKVLKMESDALVAGVAQLSDSDSQSQISGSIDLLNQTLDLGGKIVITGVGKSGKIGQKISSTLTSTGSSSVFLHPTEALHGDLGIVQKNDTVIALSQTGNSEEIVRFARAITGRSRGLIVFSSRKDSELGSLGEFWINTTVKEEACPHNLAPTTSTTLMLAIGDALAISLMILRKFKSEDFATNHPGGALGRKLTSTVKDLMHSGKNLPIVTLATSATDVIEMSTEKKLGAVAVVENGKLAGLITDGDIRRALSHQEKFFGFRAQDFMTAKPITIDQNSLAADALHLMESRSSQISVLPVVDTAQSEKLVGLIRLHDLIRTL
ncbi:MAG: KpsF/GutQ family sugar-phosphate isomerase [Xanthomonadaceae bacterium]|nr:KpsF/GutQ family sugar-phosphate isomerase [Xanthomonadaceae bacterium]